MAKSHYTYHDLKVDAVGAVTMVDGVVSLTANTYNRVIDAVEDVNNASEMVLRETPVMQFVADDPESFKEVGRLSRADYYARAYSKCDADDTYDKLTGLKIASRKAELKCVKQALKDVTGFRKAAEALLELAKDMEDKLDQKMVKLAVDLAAAKN